MASATPATAPTPAPTPSEVGTVVWAAGCGPLPSCLCRPGGSYCTEGILARSTDRGRTWTSILFGDRGLGSVDFADRRNGFAVGTHGVILRTSDGGDTWTDAVGLVDVRDVLAFVKVRFLDPERGFILGVSIGERCDVYSRATAGFVLATRDGGESWQPAPVSSEIPLERCGGVEGGSFSSICFTPEGVGLIAGNPPLLSRDGGETWIGIEERLIPDGTGPRWDSNRSAPQGAACQAGGRLWLASPHVIWGSRDGGETWSVLADDFNDEETLIADLAFRAPEIGVLSTGAVFRTDDGGLSWSEVDVGIPAGLGVLTTASLGESDLLCASYNVVSISEDGGASWQLVGGITDVPDKLFAFSDLAIED